MKIIHHSSLKKATLALLFAWISFACNPDILKETPKDFFSTENAFTDAKTFQLAVNTLYSDARNFIYNDNGSDNGGYPYREYLRIGTDVASVGQKHRP